MQNAHQRQANSHLDGSVRKARQYGAGTNADKEDHHIPRLRVASQPEGSANPKAHERRYRVRDHSA